jgi:hypothetical protein
VLSGGESRTSKHQPNVWLTRYMVPLWWLDHHHTCEQAVVQLESLLGAWTQIWTVYQWFLNTCCKSNGSKKLQTPCRHTEGANTGGASHTKLLWHVAAMPSTLFLSNRCAFQNPRSGMCACICGRLLSCRVASQEARRYS